MSEEEIQVVKAASCPSLSKASTITYEIGSKGDCQYIRLVGNSAGGLFCRDWISMADIKQLLSGSPKLTSKTLQPLYVGKSSNSPGFLLAAIVHENQNTAGNDSTPAVPRPEIPPKPSGVKIKKKQNEGGS